MAMKCNQCGTLLVPGSRSCPGCGQQFATAVPPDTAAPTPPVAPQMPYGQPPPAPYNAPQAQYGQPPPAQAPYGQAPQYGAPPPQTPYGQQPYGQAPQYGQPPPYGQPLKNGVGNPGAKKAFPWIAVCLGIAAIVRGIGYLSPSQPTPAPVPAKPPVSTPTTPSDPATPTQPDTSQTGGTAGLPGPVAANYTRVDSLCAEFMTINKDVKPDDAAWRAQMEKNASDLKSAADEGQSLDWPANLQDAGADYRNGLALISDAAGRWPAALENKDKTAITDCGNKLQNGALQVLKGVHLAQSRSGTT